MPAASLYSFSSVVCFSFFFIEKSAQGRAPHLQATAGSPAAGQATEGAGGGSGGDKEAGLGGWGWGGYSVAEIHSPASR